MATRRCRLLDLRLEERALSPRLPVPRHIPPQPRETIAPTARLPEYVLLRLSPQVGAAAAKRRAA